VTKAPIHYMVTMPDGTVPPTAGPSSQYVTVNLAEHVGQVVDHPSPGKKWYDVSAFSYFRTYTVCGRLNRPHFVHDRHLFWPHPEMPEADALRGLRKRKDAARGGSQWSESAAVRRPWGGANSDVGVVPAQRVTNSPSVTASVAWGDRRAGQPAPGDRNDGFRRR
jgi:hypothetical protein